MLRPSSALAIGALGTLLAFVLAGCWSPASELEVRPLPSPRIAEPIEFLGDGQFRAVPGSGDLIIGVLYNFRLYSHCGLRYPLAWDLDGSFWDPAGDPLGHPGSSIGNPFDDGTIYVSGDDEARFTSSGNLVVLLVRSSDTERRGTLCI